MGIFPCLNRDPSEKAIIEKENSMMISKFSILQIKDVFFYLNNEETITYANVMRGMVKLTSYWSGAQSLYKEEEKEETEAKEAKKNFKALLEAIIDGEVAQKFEHNKFKFKSLMIMLILMSKDTSKDKIQAILQMEAKKTFNSESLTSILGLIFKTVSDCSLQMILSDAQEEKKKKEIKKYNLYQLNIDKVVKDSVEKIFKLGENKTSLELSLLFLTLIASMQYDPASTFGIRKILKDYTNPESIQAIDQEGQPQKEGEGANKAEPKVEQKENQKLEEKEQTKQEQEATKS